MTHVGGLRKGEGKARLVRARALAGPLDRTRRALLAGRVCPGQADLIVTAVAGLPSGELVRARGEKVVVDHAGRLDASDLARTGRHLVHVVDPDAEDRRLERELARAERAAHAGRYLAISPDGAGGVRIKGCGSVEDGAILRAALLPQTAPASATSDVKRVAGEECEEFRDLRSHGARLWDALVSTAQHALDTDLPPETHGARPRLVITIDHHTLTAGLEARGVATTTDGLDLSPATARRLACDADLVPAVLGAHGEVLDVGRTRRLVTPAIWTALVLRDRHCTFPGCTRPPLMCHAHHIRHWLHGGTTTLTNLALLCGHHHRTIHHTPWQIRLNPHDPRPEFKPPPRPGRPTEWTRYRPRQEQAIFDTEWCNGTWS